MPLELSKKSNSCSRKQTEVFPTPLQSLFLTGGKGEKSQKNLAAQNLKTLGKWNKLPRKTVESFTGGFQDEARLEFAWDSIEILPAAFIILEVLSNPMITAPLPPSLL